MYNLKLQRLFNSKKTSLSESRCLFELNVPVHPIVILFLLLVYAFDGTNLLVSTDDDIYLHDPASLILKQ